ncbi:hypothetical protein [Thermoflexibacter ruber]|nr:hypothetical protein [Thermoflexibacter ruber]
MKYATATQFYVGIFIIFYKNGTPSVLVNGRLKSIAYIVLHRKCQRT